MVTIKKDSKALAVFFMITIPIAWSFWIPMYYVTHGLLVVPVPVIVFSSLGGLSPLISLKIIELSIFKDQEKPKFLDSILKMGRLRGEKPIWLIISALLFPLLTIASAALNYALGFQDELRFLNTGPDELGWFLLIIIPIHFFAALITSPLFEEPGWRGFALTGLEKKWHPLIASVIVGCYWWLWHQGMNIAFDNPPSIPNFLSMVANSFLIDAIFRKSQYNLLTAMFAHQSWAIVTTYLFSININIIQTLLAIIAVTIIYASNRDLLKPRLQEQSKSN